MKSSVNKWLWGFAILVICLTCFLGLFIDLTGDSGLYAAISRQMVESGDWFNLKINGVAYKQKPHLLFWLAGIGIHLFGNTNFAFKIFPALWGITGVYFTFRLGKQLFSKEAGMGAAIITGTSQIFFLYLLDIHTDSVLQTSVTLALWQLAVYLKKQRPLNFIFGFVGVGLAMLSKGPVGAVLPFFAVLVFLLATKDYRQLFHPKWLLGILIVFFVISPELVHLTKNFGEEGIKFYFITNNFGRITGEYAGSSNDPFYYLYNLLWAFLPWSIVVIAAIISEMKSWNPKQKLNGEGVYLLGSVLFFLLILSIAKGKAPNYFLIAVPPLAVLAGNWLTRFSKLSVGLQKRIIIGQYIVVGFLLILLLASGFFLSENRIWFFVILAIDCIIAFLAIFRFEKEKFRRVLFISFIATGVLNLFFNTVVIPQLFKYQGARQALAIYEKERGENDLLLNLHLEEYELFYYAKTPVVQFKNWEDFYKLFAKEGLWVYTTKAGYEGILNMKNPLKKVYVIKQHGMNRISFPFLVPSSRNETLTANYLIKVR
ncbi:MAG: glycosyltransferase family 39 protein [Prolixibacteraceae bacterium]|nr:glycosyltransferase family 39 protein [Prolixibacteraceae bacterium]